MFSPRLLVTLALLAAVSALPATDKPVPRPITTIYQDDVGIEDADAPWFSFPAFGNLFAPLWKLLPSFSDIGPKIIADDDKFQVVVNVKDYKKEDLKVKVKGDFIFVQGSHEAKQDDHDVFASQFFHTYTLPANCSGADVTAEVTPDGYLVVTAPLGDKERTKETADRDVPIVETNTLYKKDSTTTTGQSTVTQTTASSSSQGQSKVTSTASSSVEDDKEPTTPSSNREELTEKDNLIPHGNDISP